ncbi:Chanoclavine-I aldehyde reductase ifgG [Trichinella pseudospiralis]
MELAANQCNSLVIPCSTASFHAFHVLFALNINYNIKDERMSADQNSLDKCFESSLEVPRDASASVENESSFLNIYKQNFPEIQSSCGDLSDHFHTMSAKKKQLTSSYLHIKNSPINSSHSTLTFFSPWKASTPILPQLLKMKLPQPTLSSIRYSNDSPILYYQRNVHFINSEEINFTSAEAPGSNTGKCASLSTPFKNCIKSPRRYTL